MRYQSDRVYRKTVEQFYFFEKATQESFGHLLIDLDPKTTDELRYSSNLVGPGASVFGFLDFKRQDLKKFIKTCDSRFIFFLCECLFNILEGVVPISVKKLKRFEIELKVLTNKTTTSSVRRRILSTESGLSLLNVILEPCFHYLTT